MDILSHIGESRVVCVIDPVVERAVAVNSTSLLMDATYTVYGATPYCTQNSPSTQVRRWLVTPTKIDIVFQQTKGSSRKVAGGGVQLGLL